MKTAGEMLVDYLMLMSEVTKAKIGQNVDMGVVNKISEKYKNDEIAEGLWQ